MKVIFDRTCRKNMSSAHQLPEHGVVDLYNDRSARWYLGTISVYFLSTGNE